MKQRRRDFILPPSSFLLWDIDGALMRSVRAGSFKDYSGIPMLEEVFGDGGTFARDESFGNDLHRNRWARLSNTKASRMNTFAPPTICARAT